MESTTERIWQFEQYSSLFSKMGKGRFLSEIMEKGLAEYDDMEGIAWKWQSIDGSMTKAPTAQESVGPNPTDRGKNGTKRHILVDERGVPLSIVVTGANRHDVTQIEPVLKIEFANLAGGLSRIFVLMLDIPAKNQKI